MTRKHSKIEMIVRMTRVNVCVNTFIANAFLLIYKRFYYFLDYVTWGINYINFKSKLDLDPRNRVNFYFHLSLYKYFVFSRVFKGRYYGNASPL